MNNAERTKLLVNCLNENNHDDLTIYDVRQQTEADLENHIFQTPYGEFFVLTKEELDAIEISEEYALVPADFILSDDEVFIYCNSDLALERVSRDGNIAFATLFECGYPSGNNDEEAMCVRIIDPMKKMINEVSKELGIEADTLAQITSISVPDLEEIIHDFIRDEKDLLEYEFYALQDK